MTPTEHNTKSTSPAKAGRFAVLCGLFHTASGGVAPRAHAGTRRVRSRALAGSVAAGVGVLLFVAPAFAAGTEPPRFEQGPEQQVVVTHSTRASVSVNLKTEQAPTEWKAEYATSEKLLEEGKGTVVNEATTRPCEEGSCSYEPAIGKQDPEAEGSTAGNQLRGLKPETPYYVRFVASYVGSKELTISKPIPIKTLPVEKPEIDKKRAFEPKGLTTFRETGDDFTDTTAGFVATIDTNSAETKYSFEYATSGGGPWTTFTSGATGTITGEYARVEAHLAGLAPEKTYFVRLKASNEKGEVIQAEYTSGAFETKSFTTFSAKPRVHPPEVRNITAESAHLRVLVTPNSSKTSWALEYAPTEAGHVPAENSPLWTSVPGPGGSGTISQVQAEAAPYGTGLEFGVGLARLTRETAYYVRTVAENECAVGCGRVIGEAASFVTSGLPTVTAFAVHGLDGGSVRLLGSVDPNSTPTSAEQTITVEDAPTGGSFTLTFAGQTTASIDYPASPGAVQHALEGLSSKPDVSVEGQEGGPYTVFFEGSDGGVSEPAIEADGLGLFPLGTVKVAIVLQGGEAYETSYRFQYVSQKSFGEHGWAGALESPEENAGSGTSAELTGYDLAGVTPEETYRYRIVATSTIPGSSLVESAEQSFFVPAVSSGGGAGGCPNEEFRTGLSAGLPDCRAYEQLTPIDKEGAQEPFEYKGGIISALLVAENGERAALESSSVSWGKGPDAGQSPYFFSREAGKQWPLTVGAPQPETGLNTMVPQLYSADLTQVAFESGYSPSLASESPEIEYRVGPAGGPYKTVASVPRADVPNPESSGAAAEGWVASSADFSKLVLETQDRTLVGEESTGTKSGPDLYEYTAQGGLRQLNVNSEEGVTIGSCGARVAHGDEEAHNGRKSGPHSLSGDGSRVFFEAVPGRNCSESRDLYMRVNGESTVDIGAYTFLAANSEGTSLLLEKQSGEVHEVVLYDTETNRFTPLFTTHSNISEDDELVVSGDLGALYFASPEQLTAEAPAVSGVVRDLYRYEIPAENMPVGTPRFLVQAIGGEKGQGLGLSVSPDGRYAYFMSRGVGGLPGGGTHKEGDEEGKEAAQVFRYDSAEDVVECVSCASSFDSEPRQPSTLEGIEGNPLTNGPWPSYTSISADGEFAFFTTPAPLVPQDVDGEIEIEGQLQNEQGPGHGEYAQVGQTTSPSSDIYEWRAGGVDGCTQVQGCVALITDGRGGYLNLLLGTSPYVNASGETVEAGNVFIYTRSQLLPQDDDSAGDIYDARVDGGLVPPPARPTECEGDACSTPPAAPDDATPSSLAVSGDGNLAPAAPAKGAVAKSKPKPKPKKKVKKTKKARRVGKVRRRSGKGKARSTRLGSGVKVDRRGN